MITIITLVITSLVVLNFLLLAFSCNKTKQKSAVKAQPIKRIPTIITNQLEAHQLAQTGS